MMRGRQDKKPTFRERLEHVRTPAARAARYRSLAAYHFGQSGLTAGMTERAREQSTRHASMASAAAVLSLSFQLEAAGIVALPSEEEDDEGAPEDGGAC